MRARRVESARLGEWEAFALTGPLLDLRPGQASWLRERGLRNLEIELRQIEGPASVEAREALQLLRAGREEEAIKAVEEMVNQAETDE